DLPLPPGRRVCRRGRPGEGAPGARAGAVVEAGFRRKRRRTQGSRIAERIAGQVAVTPERIGELTLWVCAAAVVYGYFVYPIAIWILARCFGRRRLFLPPRDTDELPRVALLIPAH